MSEQPTSKSLVDQLREHMFVINGEDDTRSLLDEAADEIERLAGASAELLSICIQMREWLKPEVVKEPDRTFFWQLHERIERFTRGRTPPTESLGEQS